MGEDLAALTARLARIDAREVRELLRALDLLERAGIMEPERASAWRDAVRARAAELSEPGGEA